MLREEEAARATARTELEQIRAEIAQARSDAVTQTRIVKELEDKRVAILARSAEENTTKARAEGVARARVTTEREANIARVSTRLRWHVRLGSRSRPVWEVQRLLGGQILID